MSVPIRDFLKARRDRALGSILGFAERELWPSLTPQQRQAFRATTIDALNGYHDSVLDLVKAENGQVVRNDEVLAVLQRLEGAVLGKPRN